MRISKIPKHRGVILAAAVLALAQPIAALTLQPGQYKMEWKIPQWEEAVAPTMRPGVLAPIKPEEVEKLKGLKSSEPLWTTIDSRVVIVDESGGGQTGYDTAYVLATYKPGDTVDLSTVLQLKLLNQGSISSSEERDSATLDITLGSGESRLVRKAGVRVQMGMRPDQQRGHVPNNAVMTLFGNWFARIRSDEGEVEVQLIDKNANGAFNDRVTFDPKSSSDTVGDLIALRRSGGAWKTVPLGNVLLHENKLYKIAVSPTGETLDVQPFSGPTGVLRYETRDGKGGIVQTGEAALFLSTQIGGVDLKSGDQVTVPVEDYHCMSTVTFGPRKKRGDPGFIATIKTHRVAKVEEGKTTTFALGGPVSMSIDPDTDVLAWTAGTQARVKAMIYAGDDDLSSLGLPDPKVTLMIRDAAGRAVGRAFQDMSLGNPRFFTLKVFDYLQPGSYWLSAGFQPGEYEPGETISANKPVKISAK